jgi:hypothetical protein
MNKKMIEEEVNNLFNLLLSYNNFYNLNLIHTNMYELFVKFIIEHS